jgi:hypothetical protein
LDENTLPKGMLSIKKNHPKERQRVKYGYFLNASDSHLQQSREEPTEELPVKTVMEEATSSQ